MSYSVLLLALVMFLQAATNLSWFAVSPTFMGVIELITAILLLIEGGPVLYKRYLVR